MPFLLQLGESVRRDFPTAEDLSWWADLANSSWPTPPEHIPSMGSGRLVIRDL